MEVLNMYSLYKMLELRKQNSEDSIKENKELSKLKSLYKNIIFKSK